MGEITFKHLTQNKLKSELSFPNEKARFKSHAHLEDANSS
jgi:hypothetical protein